MTATRSLPTSAMISNARAFYAELSMKELYDYYDGRSEAQKAWSFNEWIVNTAAEDEFEQMNDL